MINALLKRFRSYRKSQYFKNDLFHTRKKYAFVGLGMHSITNLLPVLKHYGIQLKYICTKTSSLENEIKLLFPDCRYTNEIDELLNDAEVEGVFISVKPESHFSILKKCLDKGKKVFIEKPPCETLNELQELISSKDAVCKVGLQRRYWPANKVFQSKIRKAASYTYRFQTGSYIDSDIYTGLFIHPLDYSLFLFGPGLLKSSSVIKDDTGITVHLHLLHDNGVSGLIECSTQGNWNSVTEDLIINTQKELLSVKYPVLVEGELKPGRIMNIPSERLLNKGVELRRYFSANNFILPVAELNTIYLQGFYSELETFISIVEGVDLGAVKNDLPGLLALYQLIEEIKKS